mmetsp:Transcript_2293/g.5400  ORF Transcript_2293/g.5400 Transcript_2293/m.5400 type:complete len:287 (-) Transcript_2293:1338-2198(-)
MVQVATTMRYCMSALNGGCSKCCPDASIVVYCFTASVTSEGGLLKAMKRSISLGGTLAVRRAKTTSAAVLEGAVTRILTCRLHFHICNTASTSVTVLPVPGGPKTRYGIGRDVERTMLHTAWRCSALRERLKTLRPSEPVSGPKPGNPTPPVSSTEAVGKRVLAMGAVRLSPWCMSRSGVRRNENEMSKRWPGMKALWKSRWNLSSTRSRSTRCAYPLNFRAKFPAGFAIRKSPRSTDGRFSARPGTTRTRKEPSRVRVAPSMSKLVMSNSIEISSSQSRWSKSSR